MPVVLFVILLLCLLWFGGGAKNLLTVLCVLFLVFWLFYGTNIFGLNHNWHGHGAWCP